MTPQLQATLKRLPDRPGVYLLKDERGDVLYVGKAQSLRSRVRSYTVAWTWRAKPSGSAVRTPTHASSQPHSSTATAERP